MLATLVEPVRVAGRVLEVERPADPDALITQEAFEAGDEFLPYWSELWPSSVALAEHLAAAPLEGLRVLEIGCGLGLPSVVAALGGAQVTACDWSVDALAATARNAERNGARVELLKASFFEPAPLLDRAPWDLVVASDVLYEERNAVPVRDLLPQLVGPGGQAWVADPDRDTAAVVLRGAERLAPKVFRVV